MADSTFFTSLDGLLEGFEIQGGLRGPSMLRSESGVYLYHDVAEYLSRVQTYLVSTGATYDASAGVGGVAYSPSAQGLRYGRYLVAMDVYTANLANLTGISVALFNSGIQPGYPALGVAASIATYGAANARNMMGTYILVPDYQMARLPLWCPPGSYLRMQVGVSAASGTYDLRAIWSTTEGLDRTGAVPVNGPRAPVKV